MFLLFLNRRWRTSARAVTSVPRHALVNDFAFRVGRTAKEERRGTLASTIGSGEVKFNVNLSISLLVINRSDATSNGQHAPASGQQYSAATEAIVSCLSVEQNNVARNRLIDQ